MLSAPYYDAAYEHAYAHPMPILEHSYLHAPYGFDLEEFDQNQQQSNDRFGDFYNNGQQQQSQLANHRSNF